MSTFGDRRNAPCRRARILRSSSKIEAEIVESQRSSTAGRNPGETGGQRPVALELGLRTGESPAMQLTARNYRALREATLEVEPGVNALVGPNGVGKTTLISVGAVLREAAVDRGLAAGLENWAGFSQIRYLGAAPSAPVVLGVATAGVSWEIEPNPVQGGIHAYPAERLRAGDRLVFARAAGTTEYTLGAKKENVDSRTVLKMLCDADKEGKFEGRPIAASLTGWRVFCDYYIYRLRHQGSDVSGLTWMHSNGINAFSVLRNWRDKSANEYRWKLVMEGLRECFPFFDQLDFSATQQVVSGEIVQRGFGRATTSVETAANGWFAAMLHLTAVASAENGQVVCIDEFENSLHPAAIHALLDLIEDYARARSITIVLTTQSPTVLDWFETRPERVSVITGGSEHGVQRLTDLRDRGWLAQFRLGRLFQDQEFGGRG